MQISLKQDEIEEAVLDYISKLGFNLNNSKTELTFTNGRSPSGITVDVIIFNKERQLDLTFDEVIDSIKEEEKYDKPDVPDTNTEVKPIRETESKSLFA